MLKPISLAFGVVLATTSLTTIAATNGPIPQFPLNGVWAYDLIYQNNTATGEMQGGLFAPAINEFNQNAKSNSSKINQIFSYGGDMEMECTVFNKKTRCMGSDLKVYYYPVVNLLQKIQTKKIVSGFESTRAYKQGVNAKIAGIKVSMSPIIDGKVTPSVSGGSHELKGFNEMSPQIAAVYADKVARTICADNNVDGIQFDVEPFTMKTKNGQYYFYKELAKDFAGYYGKDDGTSKNDPLQCVNKTHPKGRYFSVYTFASEVNQNVADVFNQYHNGFIADSLYDVARNKPAGVPTNPQTPATDKTSYKYLVQQEAQNMKQKAAMYNVKYQFGIAASAGAHNFETFKPDNGGATVNGYPQIDYVKDALNAIKANPDNSGNFLGVDLYAWSQATHTDGGVYTPSIPPVDVIKLLQETNL